MQCPDDRINGASVLCFTPLDHRHRPTGACLHVVNGVAVSAFRGLAICRYEGEECCYLFYCNENWQVVTDSWHPTLEHAQTQAETEFAGTRRTWQYAADQTAPSATGSSCN